MRLEGDKESLQLQVTVLTEQVEAQAEKITDLENLLDDKKDQLQKTEEQLQKVVMIGTSSLPFHYGCGCGKILIQSFLKLFILLFMYVIV